MRSLNRAECPLIISLNYFKQRAHIVRFGMSGNTRRTHKPLKTQVKRSISDPAVC